MSASKRSLALEGDALGSVFKHDTLDNTFKWLQVSNAKVHHIQVLFAVLWGWKVTEMGAAAGIVEGGTRNYIDSSNLPAIL